MTLRPEIRKLYYLANRISRNAELIRHSDKPHHLSVPRRRLLRHLNELNKIRDNWSDTYKPTRVRKKAYTNEDWINCICNAVHSFGYPHRLGRQRSR